MKILHSIFSFNTGGAETMLVDIINQQCKTESISLLIVNDKLNKSLLETIDKKVEVFLIGRKESNKLQLFSTFWKIIVVLRKIHPDVIHCHENKLFPFFIGQRKKTFLTVHALNLSCWFLKFYRQIFAISQAVKDDLKKRANVDAQIVYNGIAIDEYQQRVDYTQGKIFNIVQISRLELKCKGQHLAIQAVAYLKEKYPEVNFTLTFIGDGEDGEKLKTLAVENKVENRIIFLGQKNRFWIKEHLQDFDVLIQPSLHEGFGLTIIEGLAAGLPVIASKLDGPEEICKLLNTGLLVCPNNNVDLAEKIYLVYQSYISNNLIYNNFILKNKNKLTIFDIQTTAKTYLKNYVL